MGGDYYVKYPQDYYPYEGTAEAFQMLKAAGFALYIVTNQSCIARGLDGGYDFAREFSEIGADDWFICPHDTQDHCHCRKPETGLLEAAFEKHNLDAAQCYMIGDRWSDMAAGGKKGMRLILVMTGRGNESLGCDREKWGAYEAEYVARDLKDAAEYLIKKYQA